jgi:hypothetical protein
MFRKIISWFGLGTLIGSGLLLSSCGQDVCVFGQGDCTQELNTSTLKLTVSAETVTTSSSLTFTVAGGTAPYAFSVFTGPGSVSPLSTSSTTTVYSSTTEDGAACIRVKDASSAIADRCITVQ